MRAYARRTRTPLSATAIPVMFVAFDLLRVDGRDVMCNPWSQRRTLLEGVRSDATCARLADVFDDGQALFDARRQLRAGGHRREAPHQPLSLGLPGLDEGEELRLLAPRQRDRLTQAVARAQLGCGMVRLRCRAHGVSDFSHCSLQRLNTLHKLRDHDSC